MILKYLVAAVVIAGAAGPLPAQSVNAGIEAWQHGNYANAVAIWRPLAERGDADAQFNIGQAYRLGRGVPINLSVAKSWLEKAANQEHVDAETTLGLLLFQNGDQATALKWLKSAAQNGEARAMLVYGTALFNGDTVTQDPVAGYAYIYRANAAGLPAAKDILGQIDKLLNPADRKKALAMVEAQDKAAATALFKPSPAANASARPTRAARVAKTKAVEVDVPASAAVTAPRPAPAPKPSKVAAAGPVSGGWLVQLGAFNQRSMAEAAFRKIAGNGVLAGRNPQYIPFQQFIRLRVGPFDWRASAAAACSALHVPCFAVAPGK